MVFDPYRKRHDAHGAKERLAVNEPAALRRVRSSWLRQHGQAIVNSFKRLHQQALTSFLTMLVMAIAITLPLALGLILINLKNVSDSWSAQNPMIVLLRLDAAASAGPLLANQLQTRAELDKVIYISPAQGLQQFAAQTGMSNILAGLNSNPLPGVLKVYPKPRLLTQPQQLQSLLSSLQQLAAVEHVQFDQVGLQRLNTFIKLLQQLVLAITAALLVGVVLVIVSSLRLLIQQSYTEIQVTRLLGGSHAYIRRPLLYLGIWYGLGSSMLAFAMISLAVFNLRPLVQQLAELYGSDFRLHYLPLAVTTGGLLAVLCLTGLSAWFASNSELKKVQAINS